MDREERISKRDALYIIDENTKILTAIFSHVRMDLINPDGFQKSLTRNIDPTVKWSLNSRDRDMMTISDVFISKVQILKINHNSALSSETDGMTRKRKRITLHENSSADRAAIAMSEPDKLTIKSRDQRIINAFFTFAIRNRISTA